MVLDANIEVITALRDFYANLKIDLDFDLRDSCGRNISSFTSQVTGFMTALSMQVKRARVLSRLTANRRNLVSP
jgi:hypothetical protein